MGCVFHAWLRGSACSSGFSCGVSASMGLQGICAQLVELPMDSVCVGGGFPSMPLRSSYHSSFPSPSRLRIRFTRCPAVPRLAFLYPAPADDEKFPQGIHIGDKLERGMLHLRGNQFPQRHPGKGRHSSLAWLCPGGVQTDVLSAQLTRGSWGQGRAEQTRGSRGKPSFCLMWLLRARDLFPQRPEESAGQLRCGDVPSSAGRMLSPPLVSCPWNLSFVIDKSSREFCKMDTGGGL